jgi:hypothetical protein
MLAYDVFSDNIFQGTEIQETVGQMVYIPQTLNAMNLFEPDPIRTTTVGVYKSNETLEFIPTTERGTPRSLPGRDSKQLVQLSTVNLRQEDQINANEMQNIIQEYMPLDVALSNADDEVDKRLRKLMRKLEFTREYHRFAALNGIVLDADGSVIVNFYDAFGIVQPAAITFALATLDEGALRERITQQIYRPMMRQLGARKGPGTRIGALCSDGFFDKLLKNPEVRKIWEIQEGRKDTNRLDTVMAWKSIVFGDVEWINYMGTDDGTSIAIPADTCRFFPIGAQDVFKEFRSPGEEWNVVNTPGEEFYAYVIPDPRAPRYMDHVKLYLDAHPLFACIAPDVLMRGQAV